MGALARALAPLLRPGDVIRLEGPLGIGKSVFARSLVRALTRETEEVPSPTFALVQIYDTRMGELWHMDLYRLEEEDDILELGFEDAQEDAICLIEWPQKAESYMPGAALTVAIAPGAAENTRQVTLAAAAGHDGLWRQRLNPILTDQKGTH